MKRKIGFRIVIIVLAIAFFFMGNIKADNVKAADATVVATGKCGEDTDNVVWTLYSDGELTLTGSGRMSDSDSMHWFSHAEDVKKIVIGKDVTYVESYALCHSSNLKKITVEKGNEFYCAANNVLYKKDMSVLVCYPQKKSGKVFHVPAGVKEIDDHAFISTDNLKTLTIPSSVTRIGEEAAAYTSLEKIRISGCPKAEDNAFTNNVRFTRFISVGGFKSLGNNVFDSSGYGVIYYGPKNSSMQKAIKKTEDTFLPIDDIIEQFAPEFYVKSTMTATAATLTWNNEDLYEGFLLYKYNSSKKTYVLVKELDCDDTSYKLTNLNSGTLYRYRIRGFYEKENGKRLTTRAVTLKFRTPDSSKVISERESLRQKGYRAAITTKTYTISNKNLSTSGNYTSYHAVRSDIQQFTDNKNNFCIAYAGEKYVYVKKYNSSLKQVGSFSIKKVYNMMGSIACDEDGYYYVVWGRSDSSWNPGKTTMAISKYSSSGKLIKTKYYKTQSNGDTRIPFDAGNCSIAINDGVLICNYGREMYNGHQSNDILAVYTDTMKDCSSDYYCYCSHSFNQSVMFDKEGNIWCANHGDAYERGFMVSKLKANFLSEDSVPFHFYEAKSALGNMFVLNETKAKMAGIVETSSGIVLAGCSVKGLTSSTYSSQKKNLFVTYADSTKNMPNGTSRKGNCLGETVTDTGIRWLTNYTSYYVGDPQIVYTSDDRIVLLWEKLGKYGYSGTYYMVLSSNGRVLQKATYLGKYELNSCEEPIWKNGCIYWATTYWDGKIKLIKINIDKLILPKS